MAVVVAVFCCLSSDLFAQLELPCYVYGINVKKKGKKNKSLTLRTALFLLEVLASPVTVEAEIGKRKI